MTASVAQALAGNPYPGRGIVVGIAPGGATALAYFVMGRSANSRNRVLVERPDGIFTAPLDESKVEDPSLIIYPALRVVGDTTVVTNGVQTDGIARALAGGATFEDALRAFDFEPDAPNFTPRISAVAAGTSYRLSIIKRFGQASMRAFWEYRGVPGAGHLIHTYAGDGDPLPSFAGEPVGVAVGEDQAAWTKEIWAALDPENRICLLTRFVPPGGAPATLIINRHATEGPA